jgi:prepilin-type N-terminal cleavage/methylation domain-containing protein
MKRPRAAVGFTLIEMMFAVAVLGILATIIVVAFSKNVKKVRTDGEVNAVFAQIAMREENYRSLNGAYVTAGSEASFYPTSLNGTKGVVLGALPAAWSSLRMEFPGRLYCQYAVISGDAGVQPAGNQGKLLFATASSQDWFYMIAQCDMDNDSSTNEYWARRGDSTQTFHDNAGR